MSKKTEVLLELFKSCEVNNNYEFDNDLVKDISKKVGFGNPFDATKIDDFDKIPKYITDRDYVLVHLGDGKHKFIKGCNQLFYKFGKIQEYVDWEYKPSILNTFNSSESNILSIANNQRILHHFLFNEDKEFSTLDITNRPKTYFPHRTKKSFEYYIGDNKVSLSKIQIEIDLTIEYQGIVNVFEAKNINFNKIADYRFSAIQLYIPYRYYVEAKEKLNIKEVNAVYLLKTEQEGNDILQLFKYGFEDKYSLSSITLLKSCQYKLIKK